MNGPRDRFAEAKAPQLSFLERELYGRFKAAGLRPYEALEACTARDRYTRLEALEERAGRDRSIEEQVETMPVEARRLYETWRAAGHSAEGALLMVEGREGR